MVIRTRMLGGQKTVVKKINRLSARRVATPPNPGRPADGRGLYLKIDKSGAKRWTFMWVRGGRQHEAGLGSIHAVPLAKAREKAAEMRAALADGRDDPIEARQATRAERDGRKTFGDVANAFLKDNAPSWRNAKHRAQWKMTLEIYGKSLMHMPVENIDTPAVLEALKPIWQGKPETASRLRGRIESVLDAARASGLTPADRLNPARWKGHLDRLLPKPNKLARGNHAAMPYKAVGPSVAKLREREVVSALALEFLILTAGRTGEVLAAEWSEFDLDGKVWTVP